jgi:hypothetical protein
MKKNLLPLIAEIIEDNREYWPLTLRQIYYQLVSKELIPNKQTEYKSLSRMLSIAREGNVIPWECMQDRTRTFSSYPIVKDKFAFIDKSIKSFLDSRYYYRDLQASQNIYLELWIEKDALFSLFKSVADKYFIPIVVCKGYPSKTFLKMFIDRIPKNEKSIKILYFGDMDASGLNIFDTTEKYFKEKVDNFSMNRQALLPEQIKKYKLPYSPDAVKASDTRTKAYIKKYGEIAVELDSLNPSDLHNIIDRSIKSNIDMTVFKAEKAIMDIDDEYIRDLRSKIIDKIEEFLL